MSVIAPELQTMFAQDTAQTLQMLLELLASEWDTAAETLHTDNQRLSELLSLALSAIEALPAQDGALRSLADEIGATLAEPPDGSLAISRLSTRHERLRALLERTLVACEDGAERPGFEPLMPVRAQIYGHLRQVAGRGWSFWDALSFRERMARLRAGAA